MKYLKILVLLIFTSCINDSQSWKIPIGYKNFEISLGDSYNEVRQKISGLKLDMNAEKNVDFKNYFSIDDRQIKLNKLKLNPSIFMRFDRDELVIFDIIYTIDETEKEIDFETLIQLMSENELTEIKELINQEKKSIGNNKELWLRRIDIDTISGTYPKIKYRVQAIP